MKDIIINHPDLQDNKLVLKVSIWGESKLFLNDEKLRQINGKFSFFKKEQYSLSKNLNTDFEIKLLPRFYDPVPNFEVNGQKIEIVKPLKWYQYVWFVLPILLISQGGFMGIIIGVFALKANTSMFREDKPTWLKYLLTFGVSILCSIIYLILVMILALVLDRE